jgi:hypothetical protein
MEMIHFLPYYSMVQFSFYEFSNQVLPKKRHIQSAWHIKSAAIKSEILFNNRNKTVFP